MLTRALKSSSKMQARGFFWSTKSKKQDTSKSVAEKKDGDIVAKTTEIHNEFRERMNLLKEVAVMEYKTMPKASHWNPNSPDYVSSPREEASAQTELNDFNYLIDNLKNSLKMQEEIYQKIEGMDRPYLQGRPGLEKNVYDEVKDYSKPSAVTTMSWKEYENKVAEKYANRHRFVNDAVYTPKWIEEMSNVKQWQHELDNRPVNSHFHPDKGYKFDVFTPYEERQPHVADRLGYPEFLGSNLDRLIRIENEMYHPNFLDQPFVQTPPINPDTALDFSEGEVIYENPAAAEWAKLSQGIGYGALGFVAFWKPYWMLMGSQIPPPSIFQDVQLPYFDMNTYSFDNYMLTTAFLPPVVYFLVNIITVPFSHSETMARNRRGLPFKSSVQC